MLLNIQVHNIFNSTGIFSVEIHAFKVIRLVIKMKLGNNFTCVLSNFFKIIIWKKTQVKLFVPYFQEYKVSLTFHYFCLGYRIENSTH